MSYQPSEELLEKYADVMINFALNGGEGVKNGEVVQLRVSEVAKPLLVALRRAVLKAGAHPIIFYMPDEFAREHYELASDEQLSFFPKKFLKGLVDEIDHTVAVLSETDKKELDREIRRLRKLLRNMEEEPQKCRLLKKVSIF